MSDEAYRKLLEAIDYLKPKRRKYEKSPNREPQDRTLNQLSLKVSRMIRTIERGRAAISGAKSFQEEIPEKYRSFLSDRLRLLQHVVELDDGFEQYGVGAREADSPSTSRGNTETFTGGRISTVPHTVPDPTDRKATQDAVSRADTSQERSVSVSSVKTDRAMDVDPQHSSTRGKYVQFAAPTNPKRKRDHPNGRGATQSDRDEEPLTGTLRTDPIGRLAPASSVKAGGAKLEEATATGSDIDYSDYF